MLLLLFQNSFLGTKFYSVTLHHFIVSHLISHCDLVSFLPSQHRSERRQVPLLGSGQHVLPQAVGHLESDGGEHVLHVFLRGSQTTGSPISLGGLLLTPGAEPDYEIIESGTGSLPTQVGSNKLLSPGSFLLAILVRVVKKVLSKANTHSSSPASLHDSDCPQRSVRFGIPSGNRG